jgi:hypothetical protein
VTINQSNDNVYGTGSKKDGPTVSLLYKDTLTLPSFTAFDLQVKMITGYEISAISLGFYYPQEYLQIDSVVLADNVQGFYYSDTNGLIIIAWSDVNPINISDEGTLLTLRMNTLDLKELIGTIKLGLYESSEFADQFANIIEGVELEVPEVQYLVPTDTLFADSVTVGPNPFYDYLSIYFYLKADSRVRISLCDISGMEIYRAKETAYTKGTHQVKLYALNLSNGIYLLKFEIRNSEGSSTKLIKVMALR